ncbi:MAG: phosphatidate cytidylyltransferase [Rhodobacteraceae bacterium]|nr:phosphatidate cytidylyltransferase [Paracoccaceae bacterium]
MTFGRDSFPDLATRMATGGLIAGIGLAAVWAGGAWFTALVAGIVAVLVWELVRMLGGSPARAMALGAAGGAAMVAAKLTPLTVAPALGALVIALGMLALPAHRRIYAVMAGFVLVSAFGLILHRDDFGLTWMLWLVVLVAVTDTCGYFAGRLIGGPKFWPAVSPKKTWSGTVAGWIGAALVGWAFMAATETGVELIVVSVLLSLASQMGDIAESAIKRRMGVKDSSNLLPGHGGLFDRFDGLLGAALVLVLVKWLAGFPPPVA